MYNTNRFYYIQKEGGEILELDDNIREIVKIKGKRYSKQDKRYIGKMKLLMSDAPELFPQIEKIEYLKQTELVDLAVNYHNSVCSEYECINYTKKIPRVTYKLEVFSGVSMHSSVYTPQYGVVVHIGSPFTNKKLFIKTGLIYSFDYKAVSHFYGYVNKNYIYNLKIPISLHYVFGKKAFKPTLGFGFPTGLFLISSIQGGFLYSVSRNLELSCSASSDALLLQLSGESKYYFENNFPHSLYFGLVYKFKQR